MEIAWTNPVYQEEVAKENDTTAIADQAALDLEQVFRSISGDDHRPLLVLRECLTCTGTDDALLSREGGNDKTFVFARWFRCIRLPSNVLDAQHPFHNLFAEADPPHLYVCGYDGANLTELKGDQSLTELWGVMLKILRAEYKGNPEKRYKEILDIYDQFNLIDDREEMLRGQMYSELMKGGSKSRKFKKLRKKLDKALSDKEKLLAREKKAYELGLREEGERIADV